MKRFIKYLPLVLLFLSCTKQPEEQEQGRGGESYDNHPTWTDSTPGAFWDKQPSSGFQIDTAN